MYLSNEYAKRLVAIIKQSSAPCPRIPFLLVLHPGSSGGVANKTREVSEKGFGLADSANVSANVTVALPRLQNDVGA